MFLNTTTEYLLDNDIIDVLKHKKCPICVYRIISKLIPNNNNNRPNFKCELQRYLNTKNEEEIKFRKLIHLTLITEKQITFLLSNFLTYRQIVKNVLLILKLKAMPKLGNNYNKLRMEQQISMGCFIKIRSILELLY
tara:strand:+ start:292 stop:702 length:411 start_codon:yes stop_codon:yes gene_type:complete